MIVNPPARFGHDRHRDDHRLLAGYHRKANAQQIGAEVNILGDVDFPSVRVALNLLAPLRPEEFASLSEGETRKTVLQTQQFAW